MFDSTTLTVNGQQYPLSVDPATPLLYILRNDLGLKGPKYGCGAEQCGACKVLVDGAAVPSCQLPVGQVQNTEITTVEGLGSADAMHPLQEAFVEEGMTDYEHSLKRKLVWLVVIVPICLFGVLLYFMNFNS